MAWRNVRRSHSVRRGPVFEPLADGIPARQPWFPETGNQYDATEEVLSVGDLVEFTTPMVYDEGYYKYDTNRAKPPHTYIRSYPGYVTQLTGVQSSFPEGTTAVYLGEIRVEEGATLSSMVRRVRHTFLVGGTVHVVHSVSKLRKVQSSGQK